MKRDGRAVRGAIVASILALAVGLTPSVARGGEPDDGELLPTDALIITAATVITGSGADPIADGLVALRDGRVLAVGPATSFSLPPGTEVVDLAAGTILHGFIDAHVHETADPAIRRDFLEGGVTSVCAMGSRLEDMPRYDVRSYGGLPVARAFQAGPIMTAPGGAPDVALDIGYNYEVATPDQARAGVGDLVERGADAIKVYLVELEWEGAPIPVLDEATLSAIVEEAHARGLPVRAHVRSLPLVGRGLAAGVDAVEHVPWLEPTPEEVLAILLSDDPIGALRDMADASGMDALWAAMVDAGIVMVPTLERGIEARLSGNPDEVVQLYLDAVRRFHAIGGTLALGTDFTVGMGMTRGIPIAEMQLLLDVGLTPMEAIEAGTRHAAAVCGQGDALGTLEPGKLADLIVVSGDPLQDIGALSEVRLVILGGSVAYRAP